MTITSCHNITLLWGKFPQNSCNTQSYHVLHFVHAELLNAWQFELNCQAFALCSKCAVLCQLSFLALTKVNCRGLAAFCKTTAQDSVKDNPDVAITARTLYTLGPPMTKTTLAWVTQATQVCMF